jgi:hypothetical protein
MAPNVEIDIFSVTHTFQDSTAPRFCANCRKRLSLLNKKTLCFICNERAMFATKRRG